MLHTLSIFVLPAFMILAAITDCASLRIPNWLTGLTALAFFPMAFATGMPLAEIGWHLAAGLALFFRWLCPVRIAPVRRRRCKVDGCGGPLVRNVRVAELPDHDGSCRRCPGFDHRLLGFRFYELGHDRQRQVIAASSAYQAMDAETPLRDCTRSRCNSGLPQHMVDECCMTARSINQYFAIPSER